LSFAHHLVLVEPLSTKLSRQNSFHEKSKIHESIEKEEELNSPSFVPDHKLTINMFTPMTIKEDKSQSSFSKKSRMPESIKHPLEDKIAPPMS
jgi:hypothetical protein